MGMVAPHGSDLVTVRSAGGGFEQPHRSIRGYAGFGSFRFEREQYDAAPHTLCLR
jgi:hypothetical protein